MEESNYMVLLQLCFKKKILTGIKAECFKRNTPNNTKNVYNMTDCAERKSGNETYLAYEGLVNYDKINQCKFWDIAWALSRTMDSEKLVPTWSAHNSTNTEAPNYQSILQRQSYTDQSNLYTTLEIVQGINVATNADHKTILSTDRHLYAKCIKLQDNGSIRYQFVFRLGELHILFAKLKVIGKNINFSCLDEAFIEVDIYGPTTLQQVTGVNQRSFEAFLTLCTSLFQLYVKELLDSKIVLKLHYPK